MFFRRLIRRQDGGLSLPVEPTIVEDLPTSSNTIDYSTVHPSSAQENTDANASSDPTFFVQTTFPPITGTDLITITGTNTRSVSDDDTDESSSSSATVTDASTSTTATMSETASDDDAETTTESDGAAPTVGPGPAAAGVAALLGLAVAL
jgi:hypothetical protein